jgi:hypothetical protein
VRVDSTTPTIPVYVRSRIGVRELGCHGALYGYYREIVGFAKVQKVLPMYVCV